MEKEDCKKMKDIYSGRVKKFSKDPDAEHLNDKKNIFSTRLKKFSIRNPN